MRATPLLLGTESSDWPPPSPWAARNGGRRERGRLLSDLCRGPNQLDGPASKETKSKRSSERIRDGLVPAVDLDSNDELLHVRLPLLEWPAEQGLGGLLGEHLRPGRFGLFERLPLCSEGPESGPWRPQGPPHGPPAPEARNRHHWGRPTQPRRSRSVSGLFGNWSSRSRCSGGGVCHSSGSSRRQGT